NCTKAGRDERRRTRAHAGIHVAATAGAAAPWLARAPLERPPMSAALSLLRPLVGSLLAALLSSCLESPGRGGGSSSELAQSDAAATTARERCAPLVAEEQAIALGTLLAAGSARDGTLYVVDRPLDGEERVFVSE